MSQRGTKPCGVPLISSTKSSGRDHTGGGPGDWIHRSLARTPHDGMGSMDGFDGFRGLEGSRTDIFSMGGVG